MEYDLTARELAEELGGNVTPRTIYNWVTFGYPYKDIKGEIKRKKLRGYMKYGVRNIRFNKDIVNEFIRDIEDNQWHLTKRNTSSQTEQLQKLKTGQSSSKSTRKNSQKLLKTLVDTQKRRQMTYAD